MMNWLIIKDLSLGIVYLLQLHNAEQLVNWCRFFIASNYEPFKARKEFSLLQGAHKEYVEEHRWPPVSYIKEVEEYEKLMAEANASDKCVVM